MATITFGPGVSVGAGIATGNVGPYYNKTTAAFQNTANISATTGIFPGSPNWPTTPIPSLYDVAPGWTVVEISGATVVSTDPGGKTILITGGVFVPGSTYSFKGL